jgi:hypothetical protein
MARRVNGRFAKGRSAITVVRAPAPIVRVSAPRASKAKKHHRRHGGGRGGKNSVLANAAAGFILGKLDTSATSIPTIPVLGRAGTLAAALYYYNKPIFGFSARELAGGFAAIAAYEYSTKGSVSGNGGW